MKNIFLITILIFQISTLYSQKKIVQFKTSNEYLDYVKKEFKIPSNEIFYVSTENDSLNLQLEKFGIMLFVTDGKIATVQEVAEILNTQCSPKHLLPKVTEDAIQQASTPSNAIEKLILKNLENGTKLNSESSKYALYTFSYRFGKNAKMYYNERKEIEALGYKTIVITIDGAYIDEIADIDKTPVHVQ